MAVEGDRVEFAPGERSRVLKAIEHLAATRGGKPFIAAFDADGTLWNTDLGENFFKFQIRENLLPHLPPDPWGHYQYLHDHVSLTDSYLWLAQINDGQRLSQVKEWAARAVAEMGELPFFPDVREIIGALRDHGAEVFVVTASVKWAVEPGAELLGIPAANVLGVTTRVVDEKVTSIQEGPMTYREGKAQALLAKTGGERPLLAAGNTLGDLPLLELADAIKLAVATADPGHRNYESEQALQAIAKERQWYRFWVP